MSYLPTYPQLRPRAGDPWTFEVTILNGGTAMDITGAEITFTLKTRPSGSVIASKTSGGGIVPTGATGVVRIFFEGSETTDWDQYRAFWWDVQGILEGQPFTPDGLVGQLYPLPQVNPATA